MGNNIHPTAVIEDSARLGDNVTVGPNCYIDKDAVIGDNTVMDANVIIGKSVKLGSGNTLFANSVVGRPPQLLGWTEEQKVGQLEIGDNNTIRENVTIHPSMHPGELTKIGSDNLIMVGVHIGHDCILEDKIVVSNYTQISGHCKVETGVWLSGIVAVHQFVTLGKWCYAAGLSGINHDIPPFVIVSGHYPNEVRSINKRGLKRAGYDDQTKESIMGAFKKIYKSNGIFIDRVKELAKESDLDPNVRYMVEFIIRSQEHRFGRYLESFRG
ncbi:Acyl-[acyl-carrier-protein]--UDP-N-acetylglucosamine O-acyltransferase [Anaerohalosphaera lusitana]|uniref:Acyl-[acyl-carrier-protein]--UDP-N-acetylglucosamine O-acyltransferase n=1 Tax=Anaerohalosphaera lusitana TaxID=1936003 RepID=A0A1U9NHV0_9BACT|nr:acyl-ACP--UDP-N-acetylglucosamine O-acyltransferase [Anaerohalosphaera lusitana]AQT67337.1 Acyl-[acyl-carrier-protein]--UDP-N-acetylglucosamine O-acyltransferase [Anaerohalosphaera lusitana]